MESGQSERLPFDPLSDVLALLKPQSYAVRGLDVGGAWSIEFPAGEGIKCYAIHRGSCWLLMEGLAEPVRISAGDCLLLPRGRAFRLCSHTDVPALAAEPLFSSVSPGKFVTLNGGGDCSGLGGYFTFAGAHSSILLDQLPLIVHFNSAEDRTNLRWYLERLMHELGDPQPGGALIVDHLAQTLLIHALRLHLVNDNDGGGIGWLFALRDRKIGAAISAMHQHPGRKWTLVSLAAIAGMSRSSFAARFTALVGEPAIEYLTRWRMHLAADRMHNLGTSVSVLADTLGYESESAFGSAFKRVMGQSPRYFVDELANSKKASTAAAQFS